MFGIVFLQPLHCIVIRVALTRIADALMMIPGILIIFDTCSDYNKINIIIATCHPHFILCKNGKRLISYNTIKLFIKSGSPNSNQKIQQLNRISNCFSTYFYFPTLHQKKNSLFTALYNVKFSFNFKLCIYFSLP